MVSSHHQSEQTAERRPGVAVVIVNWNGREDTLACLRSLSALQYPAFSIIVVDNGSTDGSSGTIRAAFPDVTVIENAHNTGFAEGNNIGIRHALNADYVLLLNNDTVVAPHLLHDLIAVTESDPRIAVAGPVICYADNRDTIWCAGLSLGQGRAFGFSIANTTSVLMYCGQPADAAPSAPYDVDAVVGCAMLIRTRILQEIGLLDESLYMIHEDFDWCLRAQQAGYRCVIVPTASVWHKVSSSIKRQERGRKGNPVAVYYWYRNWLIVVRKHFGRRAMRAVALMYMIRLFPSLIGDSLMKSELSMAVCRAYVLSLFDAAFGRLHRRFIQ